MHTALWEGGTHLENADHDPNALFRRTTDVLRTMADYEHDQPQPLEFQDDIVDDYWDQEEEEDPAMFINLALLSHIAVQLRDKIPRATHVKGSIPHQRAFTGKDVVVRFNNTEITLSF